MEKVYPFVILMRSSRIFLPLCFLRLFKKCKVFQKHEKKNASSGVTPILLTARVILLESKKSKIISKSKLKISPRFFDHTKFYFERSTK